jgi:hypothetical protein
MACHQEKRKTGECQEKKQIRKTRTPALAWIKDVTDESARA